MRGPVRLTIRAMAVAFVLLAPFGATGCSSSSERRSSDAPPDAATVPTASSLLAPVEFADYLTAHPDAPVLNVHTPYEGHIEGTDAFVSFETVAAWDGLPEDRDAPLVLYCRSGNMSAEAATDLAALGYTNITELEGGMVAWVAAGFELLDDPTAAVG